MKKVSFGKILALLLFCFIQTIAFAQEREITGTVTDGTGLPLPGVSILIKGTTQGGITDLDGNYTVQASNDAILVFSYIGYLSAEVTVGDQSVINMVLKEDIMELDEIVVIGYGSAKKSDLTGAMASLGEDDFNKAGAGTPEQMIQGRVAGVSVVSNNGEPGAGSQIKIRGASTIRSGAQPLYVVDGIALDLQSSSPDGIEGASLGGAPATNPLTFINPNDIEKIDILKDASAAAIYGSRGANGVILITTKKGKDGKSMIDYSSTVSFSQLPHQLKMLDAHQWVSYREDTLEATEYNYLDPIHNPDGTNWQDEIFRNAISNSHNLALSGGNPNTTYRVSFGYSNEQGIIKKSDLERYSGRVNLTQKGLNDHLFIEANLIGSFVKQNRPPVGATGFEGDLLLNALQSNPTWPVYDSTGMIFQTGVAGERNPVAMLEYTDDFTKTSRILGGIAATVNIIDGLNYKVNLGIDYSNANRFINQSQQLSYQETNGRGDINNKELYNFLIEHTLNYNKTVGEHSFGLLAGFSYQKFEVRGSKMSAGGYATDEILYSNNIGAGTRDYDALSSYSDQYQMQSIFGRANYNYGERYLLTMTVRSDGSSKFGVDKKYGVFPSFAAAWRISQESFMENIDLVSNLKLRVGWGQTGNSEVGTKNSRPLLKADADARALVGTSQTEIIGLNISRTANPLLTWESTSSTNLGIDFGFFNGKLSGSIDVYQKNTNDLLLEVPTPPGSPTSTVFKNIDSCKIVNQGIEFTLMGAVLTTGDLKWDVSGSMTLHRNEVQQLAVDQYQTGSAQGQGLTGEYVQIITSGQPMNVFWGFEIDSITDQGRVVYVLDSAGQFERKAMGQPQPKFTWGLSNTFNYKGFDLSIFVEGVHGHQVFNNTALLLDKRNLTQARNAQESFVYDEINAQYYTPRISDRYIEDADFVRISNITLGYNFKLDNPWVKSMRLYASASNLFIFTNYSGYDPDVSSTKDMNGINSFGIDNTNYPKARTYLMGLNVAF